MAHQTGSAPTKAPETKTTVTLSEGRKSKIAADVKDLLSALDSNDVNTVISVIANCSLDERMEIMTMFDNLHEVNLLSHLQSKLSGPVKTIMFILMSPSMEHFYAKELFKAMDGLGTHEWTLIDILCTLPSIDIAHVKKEYEKLYNKTLEEDIEDDTSGAFKYLMLSLCNVARDTGKMPNKTKAQNDAQLLMNEMDKKKHAGFMQRLANLWAQETDIIDIFVTRSYTHLKKIFEEYAKIANCEIEDSIEKYFVGDIKHALLTIVYFVKDEYALYAKRIHDSILFPDDTSMIRLFVSCSECDVTAAVREKYKELYTETIEQTLQTNRPTDACKDCLLTLMNKGNN